LQIVWFPAAPLWAFLIIILDVVIIYQLTARWGVQARWDGHEPEHGQYEPSRHRQAGFSPCAIRWAILDSKS
jgi:hypothetical protein